MIKGRNHAAKVKNHQWRRGEAFGELWFSRIGHRPREGLYENPEPEIRQVRHPWGHLPVLPVNGFGGNSVLESKVHALVNAMAVFWPAPQGLAAHLVSFAMTTPPLIAVDSGS